jgi:hypothetical protein
MGGAFAKAMAANPQSPSRDPRISPRCPQR